MAKKKTGSVAVHIKNEKRSTGYLDEGNRGLLQLLSPASIELASEDMMKIEGNYCQTFTINAFPTNVSMGWMNSIYSYPGDIDVACYIEPANERLALDEITNKITQYETQLQIELERGSIRNLSMLRSKISMLYEQRANLERSIESMFHVSVSGAIYNHDAKELKKEMQKFTSRQTGRKIGVMPLYLRQDDGYRSVSPFNTNLITDYYRNMNTGALSTMFPYYNPELFHPNGTFIGINRFTNTPVAIEFFNKNFFVNANLFISGMSGSGKTYLVSLIELRSTLESVKTVNIDVEGEFKAVTNAVKGQVVRIATNSDTMLNPFDIDEEVEVDDNGNPTGRVFVNIKAKAAELLNLLGIMMPKMLDNDVIFSEMSNALIALYYDFGFTENVESLYVDDNLFDEATGVYRYGKTFRNMPTMSDYKAKLLSRANEISSPLLHDVVKALDVFTKGGMYDLFDCRSNFSIELDKAPITTFDLSGIEDDRLRPIAMQVALSWSWSKFVKKDLKTKKRIVCDEAWMMLKSSMPGYEYTSTFLENCARRIRKYNGSLCCASQNFKEFTHSNAGEAILTNSLVKIFLKQAPEDIEALGNKFLLSEGEKSFLQTASRGEILLKVNKENYIADVFAFSNEHELIARKHLTQEQEGEM